MARKVALVASFLAAVTLAPSALADAPPAEVVTGWSGQALLGYGFHDGVGLGLNVRGGYTLDQHIYVGGLLGYHLGSNDVNIYYLGIEGGYDIAAGPVIVRPYLGLGDVIAHVSVSTPFGSISGSSSNFGIWPGCQVLYPISEQFFVGGDARILVVNDFNTLMIFGVGGMHF